MRPLLLLPLLAACAPGGALPGPDACGASGYRGLVGQPLAAVTLPAALNDRVIRPGTPVTMDYDPTRLNLRLDAEGVIVAVDCG